MTIRFARLPRSRLALVYLLALALHAQLPEATVVGRIVDPSNAPVPAAIITLRNQASNELRSMQSDSGGEFTIPNLAPGRYDVTVDKEGFRRLQQRGLELQVQQTARLDLRLEVGTVSESIEVTASIPVLNTENAVRGDVVANAEIVEMPLNGRSVNDLAYLVPGVAQSSLASGGEGLAVNGARQDNTNYLIDGISNNSPREQNSLVSVPLDAVQEFRMQTSGYSAEFGRLAGGVMTVALKSGGNQPHGALFEFFRNDKVDARNFFADDKDKLRRNQFGGVLSGPVWIPKVYNGRDRTFFLFSWESYREVSGSARLSNVPPELERQGDFSQTRDATGKLVMIRDPFASGNCTAADRRGCFPDNRIPLSRFHPVTLKLLPYYPLPNRPGMANNLLVQGNPTNSWDNPTVKIDHRLSSKDSVSFRYLQRNLHFFNPFPGAGTELSVPGSGQDTRYHDPLLGLSYTRMFTPSVINEFRAGLARGARRTLNANAGQDITTQLGMPGSPVDPKLVGFPRFSVRGISLLGNNNANPLAPTLNNFTYADTLTLVRGRHMVKLGGEILRFQMFQSDNINVRGTLNFLGRWTNVPFADLLLGLWDSTTRRANPGQNYMLSTSYGFFFQDDFKVRPDLTLNLGLRYELPKPTIDKYGRMASFMLEAGKLIVVSDRTVPNLQQMVAEAGLAGRVGLARDYGMPDSLSYASHTNFAPRFGLAWRPKGDSHTVVRGGYGIFYAGSALNSARQDFGNTYPFAATQAFQRQPNDPRTLSDPFPLDRVQLSGVNNVAGYELHPPSQYLQSWSFSIDREVASGTAIEASYAGSKGTHLGRRYNINQPFRFPEMRLSGGGFPRPYPDFNIINYYAFGSNSSYNAATITLRRRFARGAFYRVSYVFSKSLDDTSYMGDASIAGYGVAQDARNLRLERGRSDFDRRQVLSMNFSYEVPSRFNRFVRGWQLAGTGMMRSGDPITPALANVLLDQGEANRPDRIGNGRLEHRTPERWFDLSAFVPVPTGSFRFGNSGRNILDGPGFIGVNVSLSKRFYVREGQSLQLRFEAFNLTNHANFRDPLVSIDTANAGTITQCGPARILQLGLRYQF